MSDDLRASYDATPYDSKPFRETHIDHLATIARFHGLSPAPIERCRVLELGCASGGNIIPMADRFPDATFLGVDLSPVQIADGQRAIDGAKLTNVVLQARSITDLGAGDGEFDYIICHGVYSWVPPEVQDAVLRVCEDCLSPNGIAYVSYNAYPGWHARMMVREMMLVNDTTSLPPATRIARARNYVERLGARAAKSPGLHAQTLQREIEILRELPDSQILHEFLEAYNTPLLFTEFVRRASEHRLAYVANASFAKSGWANPDEPANRTREEVVRAEQESDFVVGRVFHRSLLSRVNAPIDLTQRMEHVRESYVSLRGTEVSPNQDADENQPGVRVFATPEGSRLGTASAVLLAAFDELLAAAPEPVHFSRLVAAIEGRVDASSPTHATDIAELPAMLLRMVSVGMAAFGSRPAELATRVDERPRASALARWQASQRLPVTDRMHVPHSLPAIALFLLSYLDGTRDRDQLVAEVQRALDDGRMSTPTRPDAAQIAAVVDESLRRFMSSSLLLS